jgi:hypothetical protein
MNEWIADEFCSEKCDLCVTHRKPIYKLVHRNLSCTVVANMRCLMRIQRLLVRLHMQGLLALGDNTTQSIHRSPNHMVYGRMAPRQTQYCVSFMH